MTIIPDTLMEVMQEILWVTFLQGEKNGIVSYKYSNGIISISSYVLSLYYILRLIYFNYSHKKIKEKYYIFFIVI